MGAGKIYVGDIGTDIILNTNETISSATITNMKVKKPDGTTATWVGALEGTTKIKYTVVEGDLSVAGTYKIQAYVSVSGWTGLGETATFQVYAAYN